MTQPPTDHPSPRAVATRLIRAALAAVEPRTAVVRSLGREPGRLVVAGEAVPLDAGGGITVVGAGKASVGMARGAAAVLGDLLRGGVVVAPHGAGGAVPGVEVWEASHPVPDTHGMASAAVALEAARGAGAGDLVLCLLSGGASALWPAPPAGVPLSHLQQVTEALLRAGAPIGELNAVRKHLSRIAGGRLARAAHPARVVTLLVSDVVGSPLEVIASGPTVPDPTTFADALEVLARRGVEAPPAVLAHLRAGAAGEVAESPKPGDPVLARVLTRVVARNRDALEGAAREAERLGMEARVVGDDVQGEAREVGRALAAEALRARAERPAGDRPLALLWGGETTVTVTGDGRGGRSQEVALAASLGLEGSKGILLVAFGTDGRDGPTDAAGGIADGGTAARGRGAGLDPHDHLRRNDAHPFLHAAGDLLVTGPTGTNVNDVILALVSGAA